MSNTITTYSGWHRPRSGTWEKLVTASTFADAWAALLDAAQSLPAGESIVLQGIETPVRRRTATRGSRA